MRFVNVVNNVMRVYNNTIKELILIPVPVCERGDFYGEYHQNEIVGKENQGTGSC